MSWKKACQEILEVSECILSLKSRKRYMESFCKVATHLNIMGMHRISWKAEFKFKVYILVYAFSFFLNQKILLHKLLQMYVQSKNLTSLLLSNKEPGPAVSTCISGNWVQPTPACMGIRSLSPSLQKAEQIPLPLPLTVHTPSVSGNFSFNLKKSIYTIPSVHSTTILP